VVERKMNAAPTAASRRRSPPIAAPCSSRLALNSWRVSH
jgi:hypothetical protein